MATPNSRQGLIDYCLRELGHPVIEINVDDDQLSDRIDQAFQYYQDYHYDGVERIYLKHKITASEIIIASSTATSFTSGETVTGQQSGATGRVVVYESATGMSSSYATSVLVRNLTGNFTTGEVLLGSTTGHSSTVVSYRVGDIDRGYIDLDDSIIGVVRVLPFSATNTGLDYMFDLRYQLRLNDLFDLLSTSIIYYQQVKQHLSLIDMLLVGEKSFRFARHQNRLNIDMRWGSDVKLGEHLLIECWKILDPNVYTDVYNDRFLKRYATALIKKQWGNNLKKFSGITMPGGVTLNGDKIYDEAVAEIEQLEVEMRDTYQEPPRFMLG